jgi:hypothetical protein
MIQSFKFRVPMHGLRRWREIGVPVCRDGGLLEAS